MQSRLANTLIAAIFTLAFATDARAQNEIVIGAPISLSGSNAAAGDFMKWGYERAADEVNRRGGLSIGGVKRQIKLVLRDDRSDPNVSASLTESLISRDGAVALLGSSSPALVNPDGIVADRHKIPMVTAACPIEAFKSVRSWKYTWCIFFDEPDLAAASLHAIKDFNLPTNNKIAILHDNGPDGVVVGGEYWPKFAKELGFDVVATVPFPVDNTQFTSIIEKLRGLTPDIVFVDASTPQAILIRKQLAAAGITPKVLVIEKGAEPVQFSQALGKLAEGVMVGGYWDPSFPFPGAQALWDAYVKESGKSGTQHIADMYTAASVLFDAIEAADSLDPEKINEAIAKTDKTYVVGPVKFDAAHASKLPMSVLQWQEGRTLVVWPKDKANGKLIFPIPSAE